MTSIAVQPARLTPISSRGRKPSSAPPTAGSAPSGTLKPLSAVPVKVNPSCQVTLVSIVPPHPFLVPPHSPHHSSLITHHFPTTIGVTYFSSISRLITPLHARRTFHLGYALTARRISAIKFASGTAPTTLPLPSLIVVCGTPLTLCRLESSGNSVASTISACTSGLSSAI